MIIIQGQQAFVKQLSKKN